MTPFPAEPFGLRASGCGFSAARGWHGNAGFRAPLRQALAYALRVDMGDADPDRWRAWWRENEKTFDFAAAAAARAEERQAAADKEKKKGKRDDGKGGKKKGGKKDDGSDPDGDPPPK